MVLSFFGGVYALLPYFALWNPPSPPISESELRKWPFNVLESKVTAGVTLVAGLGLILYSVVGNPGDLKEFYQYFRESKFVSQRNQIIISFPLSHGHNVILV